MSFQPFVFPFSFLERLQCKEEITLEFAGYLMKKPFGKFENQGKKACPVILQLDEGQKVMR